MAVPADDQHLACDAMNTGSSVSQIQRGGFAWVSPVDDVTIAFRIFGEDLDPPDGVTLG